MKECLICKQKKEISEFYKKTSSKDNLYPYCKVCTKLKNKTHYLNNKEYHKALTYSWRKVNREKHNSSNEAWRKRNLDKVSKSHYSQVSFRRASKINATPSWANKFIIDEIYNLANLRTKLTGIKWHVDHIVPLVSKLVCGLHVEQNLQVIPASVNYKKGNRVWPEMP